MERNVYFNDTIPEQKSKEEKPKVYFDMDGTLAQWQWVSEDIFTSKGYYRNLPVNTNVVEACKQLIADPEVDVYILSAVLQDDHSLQEKNEWLDEYFGDSIPQDHRIFVPYGESKADYVSITDKDILIDDYNPNLTEWNGISVKILNGENQSTSLWDGYMIDFRSSGQMLAQTIKGIQSQGNTHSNIPRNIVNLCVELPLTEDESIILDALGEANYKSVEFPDAKNPDVKHVITKELDAELQPRYTYKAEYATHTVNYETISRKSGFIPAEKQLIEFLENNKLIATRPLNKDENELVEALINMPEGQAIYMKGRNIDITQSGPILENYAISKTEDGDFRIYNANDNQSPVYTIVMSDFEPNSADKAKLMDFLYTARVYPEVKPVEELKILRRQTEIEEQIEQELEQHNMVGHKQLNETISR